MLRLLVLVPLLALAACAGPAAAPEPEQAAQAAAAKAERAKARQAAAQDADAERRIARLELQLWERDAVIEDLQGRLEDARQEVVRAMAKLQTLATRAEAATAMAEADLAVEVGGAGRDSTARKQASRLMQQSSAEFKKQNYGGALYLANQAKAVIAHTPKAEPAERGSQRAGEATFAAPIRLRASVRGNVREGPGTGYPVVFTAEPGNDLTGLAYLGDWVRVMDGSGRTGWIARSLIGRRE